MPVGSKNKALVSLQADGDRLDDARRRLLADWCRLVGQRVSGRDTADPQLDTKPPANPPAPTPMTGLAADGDGQRTAGSPMASVTALGLPKRMSQILMALLAGASEKQIAASLSISPHTVHTYVKQLHKRLDVSSRGELLARFVQVGE